MSSGWRPSLALVLMGGLAGTLAMSFAALVAFRYLGPAIGFRQAALLMALCLTLATALPAWLLVRLLLRPIHALERFATAQERGIDAPPPRHFGTRELHATSRRVIAMATALRAREATVRAFADHATHELKTPVSAIRAAVELIEDGPLSEGDRALLGQIDGARRQMETQLDALRRVVRAREVRYLGVSTLQEVLPRLEHAHPPLVVLAQNVTLPVPISAEGPEIVLHQLLRNAAESGAQEIRLKTEDIATGPVIYLQDDGPGISPGHADRIFDPFFTSRRETGGTGMGLAIVRTVLRAHGADIKLSKTQSGAAFELQFSAKGVD